MNNVLSLIYFSFKKIISNKNSIFAFFLILISMIFFFTIANNTKSPQLPVVGLSIEDDSDKIKIFMNQIIKSDINKVIKFEKYDRETGLQKLEKGEIIALIRVRENTVNKLFSGEKVFMDLYLSDENSYISKILTHYITSLMDVLNTAQNSGLIYMNSLKNQNYDSVERQKKFQAMYLDYVRAFTTRNKIITGYSDVRIFGDEGPVIFYYYTVMLIFLVALDIFLSELSPISDKKLSSRLILSGYKKSELILGKNLLILLVIVTLGIVMDNLPAIFMRDLQINKIFHNIIDLCIFSIFLRFLSEIIGKILPHSFMKISITIIMILIFFASGLILPKYFMPFQISTPLTFMHESLISRW